MKTKTYILQAGFLPIGQTDVTGWRTYSFHSGRGAYDNAVAAYRSEMNRNKNPNVKYRIVSAYDTTPARTPMSRYLALRARPAPFNLPVTCQQARNIIKRR